MIDLTMTASLRPKIIERTLQSILTNLRGADIRLIVDVAPVGDDNHTQEDVMEVIFKYFPDAVIRMLPESMQAEAIKWCWDTATSKLILHWEDDWVLKRKTNLRDLIHFMDTHNMCGQLLFDRMEKSAIDYIPYRNVFVPLGSGFWKRAKGVSLGGPPALMRIEYVKEVAEIMNGKICLDILSETEQAKDLMRHWETYLYTGKFGKLVEDIGRPWMKEMGLKKVKRTNRGVTWVNQ